jgi:hypothetical protein
VASILEYLTSQTSYQRWLWSYNLIEVQDEHRWPMEPVRGTQHDQLMWVLP